MHNFYLIRFIWLLTSESFLFNSVLFTTASELLYLITFNLVIIIQKLIAN